MLSFSLLRAGSGCPPHIIYAATAMTAKEEMEILANNRVKKINKNKKAQRDPDTKRGYLVRKDPARVGGVLLCHIL